MMTRRTFVATAAATTLLARSARATEEDHASEELWYAGPARRWLEALPIGNGRIGGMVYGSVGTERLALSESTAWSGAPETGVVNPEALPHLAEVRHLFFQGKVQEASALCRTAFLAHSKNFGTNMPLPELQIANGDSGDATAYRRSLDLTRALAEVKYETSKNSVKRNFFASHADQVLVVAHTSTKPQTLRVTYASGNLPCEITCDHHRLMLTGKAVETKHSDGKSGVNFAIQCHAIAHGADITGTKDALIVQNATTVTLLIAVSTSFAGADPLKTCDQRLSSAARFTYPQLLERHLEDYQPLYRRVSIDLGKSSLPSKPTDVRRQELARGKADPNLEALFFQYGRYLTIAGSRADSPLPLALQGIWNDRLAANMGWSDDFHLDINTQQNYWAAEVCNLSECQSPLFSFVERLQHAGASTAQEMYGAKGWVTHTVTNPWGYTAPGAGQGWGLYVTAGVWIAMQMWQHYEFTRDKEFLRARCYPVFRDAAAFFMDYMIAEPTHGWLVTGPSDSPENWYLTADGQRGAESMGATVDRVFVHALLSACIEASMELKMDADLRQRWVEARSKLAPFQIGRHGQLQEWLEDYEDAIPNHRHTSHLTALYPENQISMRGTPTLAKAAEVTIQRRTSAQNWEQTEWGRANFIAFHARLLQGDAAHRNLLDLLAHATDDNLLTYSAAGVAGAEDNIFALDGNTAGAAAMAEMLLQSHDAEIELLPALPAAWDSGSVRGLCARGALVIDIVWRRGELVSAQVQSRFDTSLKLRYRDSFYFAHMAAGQHMTVTRSKFHSVRSNA